MAEMTGGAQGPFALIQPFFGESAQDKIRKYLDNQAAANAGAVAGDPNAPFSGAYATPPSGGPPPMGAAAPGPGEPAAMKTPESWGSMLMDLQQQQAAESGFNKSVGLGLSAFAQPRNKEALVHAYDAAQPDPFKMGESLMNMSSMQQGQDRSNQIARLVNDPKTGQGIADRLHMDYGTLKTGIVTDPGMVAKIAQALGTPTPDMANLEQITNFQNHYKAAHPDATQAELESIARAITAKVAGPQAEQMVADARAFREKFGKDPTWKDNPDAYKSYIAQQGARTEALNIRATSEDKLTNMENKVEDIKNDPALPGLMMRLTPGQGILSLVTRNDAERALIQKIKQMTSDEYVRGLADPGLGTRETQQEMQYVGQSLGGILNASNVNIDDYKAGLDRLKDQLYQTHADIYGQSGDFKGLDKKYHGFVNDVYRRGGALGEGVEGAPERKPLDDDARKFIQENPNVSKTKIIETLRDENYDTSELTK